jgi:hypothetical protein
VWTGSDLEPLDDGDPLVVVSVEPSLAHDCCRPGTGTTPSVAGSKTWCEEAESDEDDQNEDVRSRIENCRHNRKGEITEFAVQHSSPLRMRIRLKGCGKYDRSVGKHTSRSSRANAPCGRVSVRHGRQSSADDGPIRQLDAV